MGLAVNNTGGAHVQAAIASAASMTGVDFGYLLNQAKAESGLNPNARAGTSSATGLYQFIEQSWLGIVKMHGAEHGLGWAADAVERGPGGRWRVDPGLRQAVLDLRRDPQAAATMAAEFASDNRRHLEAKLGHGVESVDLYLAHFLGAAGATRFLRGHDEAPDQPAATLFPAAARANRTIFYDRDGRVRSLGEVRSRFAKKFDDAPSAPAMTPADTSPGGWSARTIFASAEPRAVPRWRPHAADARDVSRPAAPAASNVRLAYLMLASLGV